MGDIGKIIFIYFFRAFSKVPPPQIKTKVKNVSILRYKILLEN